MSIFLPTTLRTISTISQLAPAIVEALKLAFPELTAVKGKAELIRLICVEVDSRISSSRSNALAVDERAALARKVYQGLFPNTPVPELDLIQEVASFFYAENMIHVRGRWARLAECIVGIFR